MVVVVVVVTMACPWNNVYREHLSDGACFLYPNDENANLIHVHDDTQYSTDPSCGRPFAQTHAEHLDPCRMYKFSLNRRVCSVATEIETDDTHLAAYTPTNAIELWTAVRAVIDKWTEFKTRSGYWPSVCTVTDAVVNTDRLAAARGDANATVTAVRSVRPVHFVKDCASLATAVDRLVCLWFENYYVYVLNTRDEERLREILRGGSSNEEFATTANGGRVKARRIECDAKDYAGGFWERHDAQKYRDIFSRDNNAEWTSVQCRLKQILDKTSLATRLQNPRQGRGGGGGGGGGASENIESDDYYYYPHETTTITNAERTRAKSLFHAIVVDTFGNHRDYPHTIMCREFIVKDKRFCSVWLDVVRKFAEYRLCRLKRECDDDEEENARTGIRMIMKEWNSSFPNLSDTARQRKRDLIKMMRKKKRNDDTIAAEFGRLVSQK